MIAHMQAISNPEEIQKLYGVRYWDPGQTGIYQATSDHLYHFKSYIGSHTVSVEQGDCIYWLSDDKKTAKVSRGDVEVQSQYIATVIRGYMPGNREADINARTNLPYVNGCSTRQIFAPERLGDPTLQLLHIPPFSSEQAHHIHSTVRVVYIISGRGVSVVGMEGQTVKEDLMPGKTCILDPMCPHHFETPTEKPLVVLPLHIFSSIGALEQSHPMFHGTHMMDQGK